MPFGDIAGQPAGTAYPSRQALSQAGVHGPPQTGIWGTSQTGAFSIVVSGGYEDDEDYGDLIVYTGQGGRDPATGKQVADQEFTRGNAGLVKSATEGLPVRVVRGSQGDPKYAPQSGYRYDGLYRVDEYWQERGRSGFLICRFRLAKTVEDAATTPAGPAPAEEPVGPAPRAEVVQQRIVRNTAAIRRVKALHDYRCQICGITIETEGVFYAEGAHIRPLGRPHDGPDVESNVLCLCPNDHARFDLGVFVVEADFTVRNRATGAAIGPLRRAPGHSVDPLQLAYHRGLWGES